MDQSPNDLQPADGRTPAVAGAQPWARLRVIEQQIRHMLAAARVADWKLFWQLEIQCGSMVQEMQALRQSGAVESVVQGGWPDDKQVILLRILSLDAQIRELLEPPATGRGQASLLH
jgi:hypothetical protein